MSGETTFDVVADIIADITGIPSKQLTPATRWNDIGMESIDLVDVWAETETHFLILFDTDEVDLISTIGELAALVDKKNTVAA